MCALWCDTKCYLKKESCEWFCLRINNQFDSLINYEKTFLFNANKKKDQRQTNEDVVAFGVSNKLNKTRQFSHDYF